LVDNDIFLNFAFENLMNMKKEGKNGIYLALIMVAWNMLLLITARSIARRLGGDILLDTAYTAGARFVMTLPIDKQMD
jgi:hypothetical protein